MSTVRPAGSASRLTALQWVIVIIAAIGFAFDSYELLMLPLIVRPAALTEQLTGSGQLAAGHWRMMARG